MHWADHTAQTLWARGKSQVIASGITPSGDFHIGHLREILTAEMIHRACLEIDGMDSRYIFIVDSMDPLRRVYDDFLSPSYEDYIGQPLAYIPAPDDDGEPDLESGISYAEYYLDPFLGALEEIGVKPDQIVRNHRTYEKGEFEEQIHSAIEHRDKIRRVIEEVSGREMPEDWFPYNPRRENGSFDGVRVTGYERPYVHWIDSDGVEGKSDIRTAQGKLPWRVDWAAKWCFHKITCEPAGKDHGAAGGSYDTGIPICEILGGKPPQKLVYEWIQLKGMGPMSSSAGLTVGPMDALGLVPPEIMRYVIARSKVGRHIDFDTGEGLFQIADEYERLVADPPSGSDEELSRRQQIARDTKIAALKHSQVEMGMEAVDSIAGAPFRHLSMLAQIKSSDEDVWAALRKSGHLEGEPGKSLELRLKRMRAWIEGAHFPEKELIHVRSEEDMNFTEDLDDDQVLFLGALSAEIENSPWTTEEIEKCIRKTVSEMSIASKDAYAAIYWAILTKRFGPRASSLLVELDRGMVEGILNHARPE